MASNHAHEHTHADGHHMHTHGSTGGVQCCSHHDEANAERSLVWYLLGGMLLVGVFIARTFFGEYISSTVTQIVAAVAAIVLGWQLFAASVKEIWRGRASSSSLAALAIIASMSMAKFEVAGWLALILLLADQVLRRTAISAQTVIEQLVKLTPNIARVVRDGAESEVALNTVKLGDVVRVRPGENLPVDGVVISGRSTIDQASLTGEAAPHEVAVDAPVYAGTTNLSGSLDIRVTQVGGDTTIGKVSQLIAEAERSKTPKQLLIEQVSRFYVPVVLSISFLVWFLTSDMERAITVLVVTCPAALLLSSPTAMVAAFAAAARLGILVKQASYLEAAADIDTAVFDKTGTMTTGKFAVARLAPAPGADGAELLAAAANGEQHSNHPLARSILATANAARITADGSNDYEEIHGRGVRARTTMGELHVGRGTWIAELSPSSRDAMKEVEAKIEGMTGVHVMRDGRYLGAVGLEDKIRSNTKNVVDRLRELGVKRLAIFTGDRLSVAERVGRSVGVDAVEAECLPEEKHALIKSLTKAGRRTLMVGDGINDGPSLAEADVGIAMGLGGSDIATNSAGVALMNDDLSRVPFLIELSRRNRTIIAQNIAISIIVALVGLALAASGRLEILAALIFHFLGDILVIANSFRLFRFGEQYTTEPAAEDEANAAMPGRRAASVNLMSATPQPA
jgi:heavy metal translocating P-type ATPase